MRIEIPQTIHPTPPAPGQTANVCFHEHMHRTMYVGTINDKIGN